MDERQNRSRTQKGHSLEKRLIVAIVLSALALIGYQLLFVEPKKEDYSAADRLSSEDLAGLIVDALYRANVIKEADVALAKKIATEEIQARKAISDYQVRPPLPGKRP